MAPTFRSISGVVMPTSTNSSADALPRLGMARSPLRSGASVLAFFVVAIARTRLVVLMHRLARRQRYADPNSDHGQDAADGEAHASADRRQHRLAKQCDDADLGDRSDGHAG